MKKPILAAFGLILLGLLTFVFAQSDPQASALLQQSNHKLSSASDLKASFSQQLLLKGVVKGSQQGTVWLKGKQFRVEMKDQTLISNGVKMWRVLPADGECYEGKYNPDNSFTADRMFKFSQNDTKAKYIEANHIQLFPKDSKKYDWFKIDLLFNPANQLPAKMTVYNRTGTQTVYTIGSLNLNTGIGDSSFLYSAARDCPGGCEMIQD